MKIEAGTLYADRARVIDVATGEEIRYVVTVDTDAGVLDRWVNMDKPDEARIKREKRLARVEFHPALTDDEKQKYEMYHGKQNWDDNKPVCFASRPGGQQRAENDCDRCPHDKACDDVGKANVEASQSCLRTFKERRVKRKAVRMERRKGGDRRALLSRMELDMLLKG